MSHNSLKPCLCKVINGCRMQQVAIAGLAILVSLSPKAYGVEAPQNAETAAQALEIQQLNGSQAIATSELTGRWAIQASPEEELPDLWFSDGGRAFYIFLNQTPNGRTESIAVEMDYQLDVEQVPMELDITLPNGSMRKGILEFVGPGEIRIDSSEDSDEPRPQDFSNEAATFKRVSRESQLPEGMTVWTLEDLDNIQRDRGMVESSG